MSLDGPSPNELMDRDIIGENRKDITEDVEVYKHGKTFECPNCGQGTGIPKSQMAWDCPSCEVICIDRKYHVREDQDHIVVAQGGQMELADFA